MHVCTNTVFLHLSSYTHKEFNHIKTKKEKEEIKQQSRYATAAQISRNC